MFLKGCPLRCVWCHNPEAVGPGPENWLSGEPIGKSVSPEEAYSEIERDRAFYGLSGGGATVSGGEPLMQPAFTSELLALCRKGGIHTAVETCGHSGKDAFLQVLEHCDLMLFDLKETDEELHVRYTGVTQRTILDNLRTLDGSGVPFIIRLPAVPGMNGRAERFEETSELIRGLKHCLGAQIMPFHPLGKHKYELLGRACPCEGIAEPSKETVSEWERLLGPSLLRK